MPFQKGNNHGAKSHGGGRRKATAQAERDALKSVIDNNVSLDAVAAAWKRVESIMLTGGPGWRVFFDMYLDRRYGKPDVHHDLEVDGDMVVRFTGGFSPSTPDSTP